MRRVASAALILMLLTSFVTTYAASSSGDRTAAGHMKGLNLSGKVSPDGKMFRTEDDNDWTVTNKDALRGLEGHYVTVKCRIDQEKRAIRVLYDIEEPQTKHASNLGDPAFRR